METNKFIEEIKNNAEYKEYFQNIENWINLVEGQDINSSRNGSEYQFLLRIKEELKSISNSTTNSLVSGDNTPTQTVVSPTTSSSLNLDSINISHSSIADETFDSFYKEVKELEIKKLYAKEIDINMLSDSDIKYIIRIINYSTLTQTVFILINH